MQDRVITIIWVLFALGMMAVYGFSWKPPGGGTFIVASDPDKIDKWGKKFKDWFITPPVEGKDQNGNKATFEFYTLLGVNDDYGWELGSWEQIHDGISNQSVDAESFLREHLNEPGVKQRLSKTSDLISVGVASCEGRQSKEEERAKTRAQVISRSLKSATTTKGELYLLLLGQYDDASCSTQSSSETRSQRSIIIIGVVQKDQNVNLEQAVKNSMSNLKRELSKHMHDLNRSPLGALDPGRYSLFDLTV